MSVFPPEILYDILSYSIDLRSPPLSTLMTTCSVFHEICHRILYTALNFTSIRQINAFVRVHKDIRARSPKLGPYHSPRSVLFDIGHDHDRLVFSTIHAFFSRCFQQSDTYIDSELAGESSESSEGSRIIERDEQGKLVLDLLHLRVNSHTMFESDVEMVYDSLSQVNPHRFVWTGRDPPHHFSIAIVSGALNSLCGALRGYTNLTHLTLTHLMMSSFGIISSSMLPITPSLRTVYLGQVIYLDPHDICEFVLHPAMTNLESVQLVDAYRASIWGERVRRSDLERMITSPPLLDPIFQQQMARYQELRQFGYWTIGRDPDESADSKEKKLALIRKIVVCRAKTERIIGGDRVEEEDAILI